LESIRDLVTLLRIRSDENSTFTPLVYLRDGEEDEQPITFAQLDESARKLAGYFQSLNLKGKRVLITIPQGNEYFSALFGCLYAGVIAVPSHPPSNNRNMERLNNIIEDCSADYILADRSVFQFFQKKSSLFSKNQFLVFEDIVQSSAEWSTHRPHPDDIAYLQYTSGSTGNPKGIKISHRNAMTNVEACKRAPAPQLRRSVSWIPIFHDMGLISMMTYLALGNVCCYYMNPAHFVQKPIRWFKAIDKYRAQYTLGPNFSFDYTCEKTEAAQLKGLDLSCLESITCGSERVQLATIRKFYQLFENTGLKKTIFKPSYGLAEATLIVTNPETGKTASIIKRDDPGQLIPWDSEKIKGEAVDSFLVGNGPPVPGAEIVIVEPDSEEVLADMTEGEIWVHYPGSVAQGYWNLEEESKKIFANQIKTEAGKSWLRTGDLGFISRGELFVTGRIKDIVIIRGRNYYPEDIELAASQSHAAIEVNGAAAFSIEVQGTEGLAIVMEVKRTFWRNLNPDEVFLSVRQAIVERLGIAPHFITLIKPLSMTKTTSGKIQRNIIKSQFMKGELKIMEEWNAGTSGKGNQSGESVSTSPILGLREIQLMLLMKISEKAKIPLLEIDPSKPLSAYPVDSIDGAVIAEDLTQILGKNIKPENFWQLDSIDEIAQYLFKISGQKQ